MAPLPDPAVLEEVDRHEGPGSERVRRGVRMQEGTGWQGWITILLGSFAGGRPVPDGR